MSSSTPIRALVVIDVQQDYIDGPVSIQYPPLDVSLANIMDAIATADEHGMPIAIVQHDSPAGFPVFAVGSRGWQLAPPLDTRLDTGWKRIHKTLPSVFARTDLEQWLGDNHVDTITLIGYMTNNCVQATANHAMNLGIGVEVLSDATGSIPLSNDAGSASAEEVHRVLNVMLHSNYAAVATTSAWTDAVTRGQALPTDNILVSTLNARGLPHPA